MSTQDLNTALASLGIQAQWKEQVASFQVQTPSGELVSLLADYEKGILRLRALDPYPPSVDAQQLSDRIALGAGWALGRVYYDPWEKRWMVAVGVPTQAPVAPQALSTALAYLHEGWIALRKEQIPQLTLPESPSDALVRLSRNLGRPASDLKDGQLSFEVQHLAGVAHLRCFLNKRLLHIEAVALPLRRAPPSGETMLALNQINTTLRLGAVGYDWPSQVCRYAMALPAVSVVHAPSLASWMAESVVVGAQGLPGV